MRLAPRLAPLLALCALLAAVVLRPVGAGAAETCTTAIGGHAGERPSAAGLLGDGPLAASCAAAILSVSPNPLVPSAQATLDGTLSVGSDTSTIAHYQWDYGDGSPTQVTDAPTSTSTHVYATRGAYTATLTILDGANAVLDATSVSVLVDRAPVAALTAPSGTLRPIAVYDFDASGSSVDPASASVRYDWSWGDGTTTPDGGPRAQHAFASDGASTQVSVTVTDDLGARATATAAVTVADQLPLVQLIATPSTVAVGQQLTLDASGSSDPDGSVRRFCWDLSATNAFATCTGLTASVTAGPYPNPGPLVLKVKVYDDSGGSSVKGVTVTIAAPPAGDGGGSGGGSSGGASGGSSGGSGGSTGGGTSGGSGGWLAPGEPFAVALDGAAIQRLTAALRRGIGLQAVANRAAAGKLTVTVAARDAKKLRLPGRKGARPVAIGTLRLALSAGRTAKPVIKLSRAATEALRRSKPRTLRVTIRGSIAAGADTAAVVRVVLLRG